MLQGGKFQSTLSMRRATLGESDKQANGEFQSTLSMRRATAQYHYGQTVNLAISIHALHEESDLSNQQTMQLADIFQSTLSMRRATCGFCEIRMRVYFNPRSP